MHELSIAQRLVDRAIEAAADRGADRVDGLTVELGAATHLAQDQVAFCIDAVAEGTPADGATVSFERVPPAGTCDCGWTGRPERLADTVPGAPSLRCPECGGRLTLTAGRECRLTRIEIPPSDSDRQADDTRVSTAPNPGTAPDPSTNPDSSTTPDPGT
jgi:hydrogenase nickel incorporation protein HypA/HybF